MSERRNLLRAVTPMLVIGAFAWVPPLRHAVVSSLDAAGRAFGHSVVHSIPTTTTTPAP